MMSNGKRKRMPRGGGGGKEKRVPGWKALPLSSPGEDIKLRSLSPRANYTDRATAACPQS
jgi:hypothetical protein